MVVVVIVDVEAVDDLRFVVKDDGSVVAFAVCPAVE